ncbi:MAG: hypothetical protein HFI45_16520 [Lachnospiraceae bacterium]|nr:hypothetical protein [Lachnospiraceae bacterium]
MRKYIQKKQQCYFIIGYFKLAYFGCKDYKFEKLLMGERKHTCVIERYAK